MRESIIGLVSSVAAAAGRPILDAGGERKAVAEAVMKSAKHNWMAPTEDEAFMGAIAALWKLYPDDQDLRDETTAIGDRNKTMIALMNGVPVDVDALELQDFPENSIGLLEIWRTTE